MMLIDACVWIDYLKGHPVPQLDRLIASDEACVCGTVLAEVLSGIRSDKDRVALGERFAAFTHLDETRATFVAAADRYAALRRRGRTIPLSDCVLAALSLEHDLRFLTFDKHFDAFEEPTRFIVAERPKTEAPA
jgi:predicted nucleic acid-binding protein